MARIDSISVNSVPVILPAVELNTALLPLGLYKRQLPPAPAIAVFEDRSNRRRDRYGTPVYWDVRFLDEVEGVSVSLPIPPLITVKPVKNIVTTPLAGRGSTVKEIISAQDYEISFRGIAKREEQLLDEAYPEEELERLLQIFRPDRQLRVFCDYLAYFGITHVVIKEVELPTQEGIPDTVFFDIKAVSDEPFELELIER
jgi:hypothetical protein